jgi:hypothetical protein
MCVCVKANNLHTLGASRNTIEAGTAEVIAKQIKKDSLSPLDLKREHVIGSAVDRAIVNTDVNNCACEGCKRELNVLKRTL